MAATFAAAAKPSSLFFGAATTFSSSHPLRTFRFSMALQASGPSIDFVSVTGAVGQEFLSVLNDRDFPYSSLKLLDSTSSAGHRLTFQGRPYAVEELTGDSFDIALFSAGGAISREFGPLAAAKGTVVVDNSLAFRMEEGVPLVVPEVNPEAMRGVKAGMGKGALIANPNCSTIICLVAATPLHRHSKVGSVIKIVALCGLL